MSSGDLQISRCRPLGRVTDASMGSRHVGAFSRTKTCSKTHVHACWLAESWGRENGGNARSDKGGKCGRRGSLGNIWRYGEPENHVDWVGEAWNQIKTAPWRSQGLLR